LAVVAGVPVVRLLEQLVADHVDPGVQHADLTAGKAVAGVVAVELLQAVDLILQLLLLAARKAARAIDLTVELAALGPQLAGGVPAGGGSRSGEQRAGSKRQRSGEEELLHGDTPSFMFRRVPMNGICATQFRLSRRLW